MDKFIKFLDFIVTKFWIIFCSIIFVIAIFIKAEYHFGDFPFFSENTALDLVLVVGLISLYIVLFFKSELIEKKLKVWFISLIFGLIGIIFVFLVPITPFSDMKFVTEGALLFADWNIEGILSSDYLQFITKNLKVSFFYGVLSIFLPHNIYSLRLINVILYLSVAYFISRICDNLGFKYVKVVYIMVASFMPLFLYCNHIYFDLPTLFMCTLAIYFYTKEHNFKNILISGVFLGLGSTLRILAFLVYVALFVDFIFRHKLFIDGAKKLVLVVVFSVATLGIPKLCDIGVNAFFRAEDAPDESIWDVFWMGINEYEFGFQCSEIKGDKKEFSDFYNLLVSRTAEQNIKLFSKKIFWTWSQGTYQAQRYAFGLDEHTELAKFEYETPLTGFLVKDDFVLRKFINRFCRAQYLAFFFLMILGLYKMNEAERCKYRPFVYLMFGTFLVLIFYELKARYILHCMIPMIVLAVRGLCNIKDFRITKE